jgi:hypothetical protein
MVFFTTTAQVLDAIIVRFTVFTVEQIWCLIRWGGSSAYNYYYPTLSEADKLKLENLRLRDEIKLLKNESEYDTVLVQLE